MTLAEKYGIQKVVEVGSVELNENPYTYEGTFMEIYNLVKAGNLKLLKRSGMTVGISVGGHETIEQDNLAARAFERAFGSKPVMQYVDLAIQLVEANLIPSKVTNDPLRVEILNGLVTLDLMGREVATNPEPEQDEDEEELDEDEELVEDDETDEDDEYIVPADVAAKGKTAIKAYVRKEAGRCFARGADPIYEYLDDGRVQVTCIQWGRKLTRAEIDAIEY